MSDRFIGERSSSAATQPAPRVAAPSRRTFLRAAAATGVGAVLTGRTSAQEPTTIELGGETAGWVGRAPEAIAGETNPTLALEPGETYEVVWENVDGLRHDFVIIDEEGERLVGTEITDEQGATLSVEFEATEEMVEYVCTIHPTTMVGPVQAGEADDGSEEPPAEEGSVEDIIAEGPTIGLESVADGFVSPVGFEVAPGEADADRFYVLDQVGQAYVVEGGETASEPFLDLTDRMVEVGDGEGGFDERGLLGLAFHPEYDENGRLYVYYSGERREGTPEEYDHTGVLAEFEVAEGGDRVDPDSERTLLEIPQPFFNHNGGPVLFGPEGYLYFALGDGGDADDTGMGHVEDWYDENEGGNGQDTTENLLGSVLRIDVDAEGEDGRPYGIPEDNPFAPGQDLEGEGLEEYFAWGFRNPWRASFDEAGRLYVADVGQVRYEEVSVVERGGNYGWNVEEGLECFSTDSPQEPPAECPQETPDDVRGGEPLLDPVINYPHQIGWEMIGISVTGGYAYETDTVPELEGSYVFGDWSTAFETPSGSLFAAPIEEYEPTADRSEDELWGIERLSVEGGPDGELGRFVLSFGRDHAGDLYVLTTARYTDGETGEVFRFVSPGEGTSFGAPEESVADVPPGAAGNESSD